MASACDAVEYNAVAGRALRQRYGATCGGGVVHGDGAAWDDEVIGPCNLTNNNAAANVIGWRTAMAVGGVWCQHGRGL